MTDKEVIKSFKKPLIWVSLIAIVVIGIMGLIINSQSKQLAYVYEHYDYSCDDGFQRACIEVGKDYKTFDYDLGEYAVVIGKDETYTICDTDRKEKAVCVSENYNLWATCQEGQTAQCIDKTHDWTECWDTSQEAICISKDKPGTISENGYFSACPSGESSTCVNWNTESICSI